MVDENYKAKDSKFELNSNIDESKLTDDEKKMLSDLQAANSGETAKPPALAEVEMESKEIERETPSTTILESVPPGKIAENISAPFPLEPKISASPLEDPPQAQEKPPPPFPPPKEEEEEDVNEAANTGANLALENCPHCGWELSQPTIVEPTKDEKMGFLHSVLGQKPFTQQYALFGGQVTVRFRTLTTKEMDVIYNFVFKQRESGDISTIQDYWEKVNRFRLYLQLSHLSAKDGSFTHTLPDAYSRGTNSHGTEFWNFPAFDPELGYLAQIEEKILKDVLRTETIQRTISTYCSRFNRLVSKLEVMIDSPDFWNETEQQS